MVFQIVDQDQSVESILCVMTTTLKKKQSTSEYLSYSKGNAIF